ncbi:hypothetical protein WNY37_00585 [Henriciella sp. AS95]|uniref:hypothetical protein n=1 Tax=Henriciella sp. AS95 TaxID=3135782 RepID=UPI00316BFE71
MSESYVTVETTSSKEVVFDTIVGIFKDSFARSIMFINYMAPRVIDGSEICKNARIEALVQNGRSDIWVPGRIHGFSKELFAIRFSFESTAFHVDGNVAQPKAEKGRRAEFGFLCKDGAGGNCDLEIGVDLEKKLLGGVKANHLVLEIIKFLRSQGLTIKDLPPYF